MAIPVSQIQLPTEKQNILTDLFLYIILLYGREKIGKTTFFSSFPGAIFFCTEPGAKGMRIHTLNPPEGVSNWGIFVRGVDLLCEDPAQFSTVIIDTVDRAYEICRDWVCAGLNITYPGTNADGVNDYGKSWNAVKREFTKQIHRLLRSGLGVCFTSHASDTEFTAKSGDKFSHVVPSMAKQARAVVEPLVDMALYAEYAKDKEGSNRRIIVTEGDEMIWAGCRQIGDAKIPRILPLNEVNGYGVLQAALEGKPVGLDPKSLMPIRKASKAVSKLITGMAQEAVASEVKPTPKPLKRRSAR
jgi:hypothetical protein